MTKATAKAAQAAIETENTAIEQAEAAFAEREAQGDAISAIAQGKAQLRATLLADCAAIASLSADISEADAMREGLEQKPILTAYRAISQGVMSDAEVNALLCEAFGSKENKGKTPEGKGLSIRKRVRTLGQAHCIAAGKPLDKVPTWAEYRTASEIADIMEGVESGDISPSYAYAELTKRPDKVKILKAVDAKVIAEIAEQLLNPDNLAAIATSEELRKAYKLLLDRFPNV